MSDDRRLIEDLIPVEAINEVAQREKIGNAKTHPRKLHLWWARRPLAAARAAVYATLVRADDVPEEARSAEYFRELCRWGVDEARIAEARERVLAANGGEPPKVLDMFAGGGAIPLEAARLGCEATAVELNPVAHLIELCTLDYPQRFGSSLADDVRRWGARWIERAWERVGHLYPPVETDVLEGQEQLGLESGDDAKEGRRPIAYLWTRTVRCPNPELGEHRIPLVRQTWLARKKGRFVALRPVVDQQAREVRWEVVQADHQDLGFNPAGFSSRGKATCFICGAGVDADYVKAEGRAGRIGTAPLATVLRHRSGRGREYLAGDVSTIPLENMCRAVLEELEVQPPSESIVDSYRQAVLVPQYGLTRFCDLFTSRQLATLCALAQGVHEIHEEMISDGFEPKRAEAACAYIGLVVSRLSDYNNTLCQWHNTGEKTNHAFARQALPMVWDFSEVNPFAMASGSVHIYVAEMAQIIESSLANVERRCEVRRTSATQLPDHDAAYDAVITDPPYYDNISYADLSDFFYVWLKRSIGFLFPEHLEGELTPKHREIASIVHRHEGDRSAARRFYEEEMEGAFLEAHRVLKPAAPLICVYAHKTTLGWASLVEALRRAGFAITEAWPLDTEMPERSRGQGSAALASSIFVVARRREVEDMGDYGVVLAELDTIVDERLERLTEAGVSGSDLVIATIGAGLRAFTRHLKVERANGEDVSVETFIDEAQSRVLNAILAKVYGLADGLGTIDAKTRYYVIARVAFGYADVEFDEANNLARSAGVELSDLADGRMPLAQIKKGKVTFLDYDERGEDPELGLVSNGIDPSLIDILHGVLWHAGHQREKLHDYLIQARFDPEALRAVAQALQGKALRAEGESKPDEAQACERLLGAWKSLIDDNLITSS
ncbi:MAG TPA: DUF1156 domain-containing protein [Solirubrobacterales bacterium]|nr:DUF1156 domain-containing protein [Solirubrobacterales bacterium]